MVRQKIIRRISKGAGKEIRLTFIRREGWPDIVDIRENYLAESGTWFSTDKGIMVEAQWLCTYYLALKEIGEPFRLEFRRVRPDSLRLPEYAQVDTQAEEDQVR